MGYMWIVICLFLVSIVTQIKGRDKGRWEDWGRFSSCSRTCGGGVQQRTRRCIRGRSHMNGMCVGPGIEYSSCNTQPCPADSRDFRSEQCLRYSRVKVNGLNRVYNWVPYSDEANECVLKCRAEEKPEVVKEFARRVIDGTRCDGLDSFGICVAGVCQAVGCDRVIGSFMKEDKCRICGGDGTTCKTMSDIYDKQIFKVGLHKVVTIPAGATSIIIRELRNSNSYLVVKTRTGKYYINGYEKSTDDNTANNVAGTTMRYIKKPQYDDEPEMLSALGPTNESLEIELMLRDENPGIQYEYSIQKSLVHEADNPSLRYIWINGIWTRCSKSCGQGLQIRAVSCIDRQSGVSVNNDLCDIRLKPDGRQICRQQDCPEDRIGYSWVLGHWGECSSDCGIGEQTQLAYCQEKGTMGKTVYTNDDLCLRYVGPKPEFKRVCEGDISCPHWANGPWLECSVTCGYGSQSRQVFCQEEPSNDGDEPRTRPDELCSHQKRPIRQRLCTLSPCLDGSNRRFKEFEESVEVEIDCSATLYGCCNDGKTRADNWQKDNCPDTRDRERCQLAKERGPCGNYTLMYYFDSTSITCEKFWYGGCGGNDNRFTTQEECRNMCKHKQIETGDEIADCQRSQYGCCSDDETSAQGPNDEGCPGGPSLEVENICGDYGCCSDGVTLATGPNEQGCHGTSHGMGCHDSMYGCCSDGKTKSSGPGGQGCPDTHQAFNTASCGLVKDKGTCGNFTIQWFFDGNNNVCGQFWYGGCGGNQNRFATREKCEHACTNVQDEDICKLPKSAGPCRANHRRYFYDNQYKICRLFIYGGCRGNQNRFRSKADCERKCSDSNYIDLDEDVNEVNQGTSLCDNSLHGCCPDGITTATGPNKQGCSQSCQESVYGCCDDLLTPARGRNQEGCEIVSSGDDELCENTFFGCCADGVTTALGYDKRGCLDYIPDQEETKIPKVNVCAMKQDYGMRCNNTIRWSYDQKENVCKRFWFGGCGGNENNFETRGECQDVCKGDHLQPVTKTTIRPPVVVRTTDPCNEPKVVGPCRATIDRYYYDRTDGQCHLFQFGGCQGNGNNFFFLEDCEKRCNVVSITTAPIMTTTPYYYRPNFYTTIPPVIIPAGDPKVELTGMKYVQVGTSLMLACQATGGTPSTNKVLWYKDGAPIKAGNNNQITIDTKETSDRRGVLSELTVERSQLDDAGTYICRGYPHGNLATLRVHILAGTVDKKVVKPEKIDLITETTDPRVVCLQPSQTGNCYAKFSRYYYDHLDGMCKEFTYGGCGANSNNFETKTDCENYCRPELICRLSAQRGICRAYFERYFYDVTAGSCRSFVYGGCQGNPNNFETMEACSRFCSRHESKEVNETNVCNLSKKGGNCGGYEIKWYYDAVISRCSRFIYTGCDGNGNRFDTEDQCSSRCDRNVSSVTIAPVTRPPQTRATYTQTPDADVCFLMNERGTLCSNWTIFWYYNSTSQRCQRFYYGGCHGNGNRFESQRDCRNRCSYRRIVMTTQAIRRPPPARAPPTRAPPTRAPYTRAPITSRPSTRAPIIVDTCSQSEDRGTLCSNWTIYWYYNSESQRCQRFYYGGCHGNTNRFMTRTECKNRCVNLQVEKTTIAPPRSTKKPSIPGKTRKLGDCRFSRHGCCGDGQTPASALRTNCYDEPNIIERQEDGSYNIFTSAGREVVLSCQLQETNEGEVMWFRERFHIVPDGNFIDYKNGTLVIQGVTEEHDGMYSCQMGGGNELPLVQQFTVQVRTPLKILHGPTMIAVKPGENAFLHCQAHGKPKPSVTWFQEGYPVQTRGRYNVYNNGTLIIVNAQERDRGYFECRATNGILSSMKKRKIKLEVRESITVRIHRHKGKITVGGEIRLRCSVTGFPVPTLTWKKDMDDVKESDNVYVRGEELIIRNATLDDSGVYRCVANNSQQKQEAITTVQVKFQEANDKCEDSISAMNCKLIVTGRLCGHRVFSKMCCRACSKRGL